MPKLAIVVVCTLYAVSSAVLILYGIQCYVMTMLYLRKRRPRLAEQQRTMLKLQGDLPDSAFPKVVTQLPMYNERAVAARVIEAAAEMDYPLSRHEVQVLDDSTDETMQIVDETVARLQARGKRVSVIRRVDRTGFKAGALQNGLRHTDAEFIAIFDSDFVPPTDFLRKAVTFFLDRPDLGLVQGRWTHLNRGASMLTRGQAMGIDGHFVIEQAGRTWNNLFMNFNGTAGVFRREAIEKSDGWQHDTLTEDLDLSYRMQMKGWKTEYVPSLVVPAEIPEDINGFKNQQFRWAKGSIQTARKILPVLFSGKVKPFVMFQAFLHLTYYMVHPFVLLVAILTPMVLAIAGNFKAPLILMPVILGMTVSTFGPSVMYMTAQHVLGDRGIRKYLMIPALMLIGIGLSVNNTWAVFEALLGKDSPFHRTPKKGQQKLKALKYRPIKDVTCLIEIGLGVYCLVAFQFFFMNASLWVTPFLMIYSASFLFVGVLSIAHYRSPSLIDMRLRQLRPARATS